jgi:hypothetical protein
MTFSFPLLHPLWHLCINRYTRCQNKPAYQASGVSLMEVLIYFSLFSVISLAMMSLQSLLLSTGSDMRDQSQSALSRDMVSTRLSAVVPAASRPAFCQFIPDPALPARFGQNISEIWIQIIPASHEPNRDWLSFVEYGRKDAVTITENGATRSLIRYQDISIDNTIIWPQITAEFDQTNGIMLICTAGANGCAAAMPVQQSYSAWRKAISRLTYHAISPPQRPLKRVIISAGAAPVCPDHGNGLCGLRIQNDVIIPPNDHAATQFDATDWMNVCRVGISIT